VPDSTPRVGLRVRQPMACSYLLRLRITNRAPASSAIAEPPLPGSISGATGVAQQHAEAATINNNTPSVFCISFSRVYDEPRVYFFRPRMTSNAPVISASAEPAEAGSTSGAWRCAKQTADTPASNNSIPNVFCIISSETPRFRRRSETEYHNRYGFRRIFPAWGNSRRPTTIQSI